MNPCKRLQQKQHREESQASGPKRNPTHPTWPVMKAPCLRSHVLGPKPMPAAFLLFRLAHMRTKRPLGASKLVTRMTRMSSSLVIHLEPIAPSFAGEEISFKGLEAPWTLFRHTGCQGIRCCTTRSFGFRQVLGRTWSQQMLGLW